MRIVGHIESYVDNVLVGWACVPDRPDQRLILAVECDGALLAAGLANLDRQDVAAAGHGDGQCGFRIQVRLQPGRPVIVRDVVSGIVVFGDVVRTGGGGADGGGAEDAAAPLPVGIIQGNVDNSLGAVIRGWCWRPDQAQHHVRVEAWIDGRVVASAMADERRGDLINAGLGHGDHAFTLQMPYRTLDGQERLVEIRAEDGTPLAGSPLPFICLGGGPIPMLLELAGRVDPADAEAGRLAALLRCYLEQVGRILPASIGFGDYAEWRDALLPTQADDIPEMLAATRPGLAAVAVRMHTKAGTAVMVVLDEGAVLLPGALVRAAHALEASGADILYADAEMPAPAGPLPWFRPDWSYDLCLSQDYTRGLTLLRETVLHDIGPCPSATALRLRALLRAGPHGRVHHLPEVLCQLRMVPGPLLAAHAAQEVATHLSARGARNARVLTIDEREGLRRVDWPNPAAPPLFSLLIPTRDRLSLVRAAVESIEAQPAGAPYEIIIIDNQSQDPETLAWLEQGRLAQRFRVIPYDAPFNFADMNNRAVTEARGELIGFINNDVELISAGWLATAAALLSRPEVGAVGARLRFANGMIQHGGVVVGTGGLAENAFQTVHVDDDGYFHRSRVAGNYSAVTAACLFCRATDFLALGGFDARNLPVAFNDVDFCLRLRDRGKLIVWTPHIDLYHLESVSRGRDATPERMARAMKEELYMRRRWAHVAVRDPYYNPNLNLDGVPFTGLALPPRHRWGVDA